MSIEHAVVTIVVDNQADQGLVSEHGLAMLIETPEQRILFDTGQGPALNANAPKLGIDLKRVQALILSHGHYDHTGGVPHVLQSNPDTEVFCHPGVVLPRYAVRNGVARPIHMPHEAMAALNKIPEPRMRWISRSIQISRDIGLTGPIPREAPLEDTGGPFFLDEHAQRRDVIEDDMAIWLNTPRGLVICTGCCHAGLINTLVYIQRLSGVAAIRAVIGGFHLMQAGAERIGWTISSLKSFSPKMIVPCHCTGDKAADALAEEFGEHLHRGHAGMRLTF